MYKIALCDNDMSTLKRLAKAVENFGNKNELQVDTYRFTNKESFLKCVEQFDIYFLELDLKEMDGQELVRLIRQKNPLAEIVIMNSDNYYLSFSYTIKASYYLQKPITSALLNTALNIVFKNVQEKKCMIKTKEGCQKIILNDLLYVDIQQRSSCFHMKNNQEFFSTCLHGAFSKENNYLLNHAELLLVEPSLILNLDNIKILNRERIVFENNEILYLPRKAYDKIFPVWSHYHIREEREDFL